MRKRIYLAAILAVPAICGATTPGASPVVHVVLKIKPGLWEFTETPKVTGDTVFSDAMTANIPAAQREQFLANMRSQIAQPGMVRECMTQAQFERQLLALGRGCTQTAISNTPASIELQTVCRDESGNTRQDTSRHVTANPTGATSLMRAVMARGGKTMTVETAENGHWLAADCGSVKGIEEIR